MKKFLYIIFSLTLLVSAGTIYTLCAQDFVPTPVEISKEKVNIKGKLFYVHKVLKKQTLYSIANTYKVSIYELNEYNPTLKKGLKIGMLLYIPVESVQPIADKPVITTDVESAKKKKPETEVKKVSDTENNVFKKHKSPDKDKYKKHKVRWYESLNDIAVKYNVTTDALSRLNNIENKPNKRVKLKTILIPDEEFIRNMDQFSAEINYETEDISDTEENRATLKEDFPGHFEIALVLPFNASNNTDAMQSSVADFYAGALIATKELKKSGQFNDITLKTIDINRYSSAGEMLYSGILENCSMIIGPFSKEQLQPMAYYAKNHKIPIVSPLDVKTKELAFGNPYYFLFPPNPDLSLERQIEKIAKNTSNTEENAVMVLYETGHESSDLVTKSIAALQNRKINYKTFDYNILMGRGIDTVLICSIDSLKSNIVLIPSTDEAFVNDALRNLYLIKSVNNYKIDVYGINKWRNSKTVDVSYFHNLDLHLAVSYYIDYNTPETKKFIQEYRAAFNTEPSPFSYQGYDIITYFTNALNRYGNSFPHKIINKRNSLIQSDVLFVPVADGSGYANCALRDINYKNGWIITKD